MRRSHRLPTQCRRELHELTEHLHRLQAVEVEAALGQLQLHDRIEALLDEANEQTSREQASTRWQT